MNDPEALLVQAKIWRDHDPDPATTDQLDQLIVQAQADDPGMAGAALDELRDSFASDLQFGTAGLRGQMGPGPARMNELVVTRAAAGFAQWLNQQGHGGGRVIIGFDARYKSADFARVSAEIFSGAGFEVLITPAPTPTPVVVYGIGHHDCVAGVVVTASHNPANDNGYKVYLGDGSQIIPPMDDEIAAEISRIAVTDVAALPRGETWRVLDDELLQAYARRTTDLVSFSDARDVSWVYTAMHGVGTRYMREIASQAGFPEPHLVVSQCDPDPDFPTVKFPNPEEPGAIDAAIALAREKNVDLVIANDPDADRCAVAVLDGSEWRMLTGDELGTILGYDYLSRHMPGRYANSIVSGSWLADIAKEFGARHETTLTGFKWIGRVPDLAFGYEEAIGYACDSTFVPDKDGLSAALVVLRIAAELKAEGRTLVDVLDELALTYGLVATSQLAIRVSDLSLITDAMQRLRQDPPATLLGQPVTVTDLAEGSGDLPPTNAIQLASEQVRAIARPSGTEPKLKCYLQVKLPTELVQADLAEAKKRAQNDLHELRNEINALVSG